MSAYSITSGRYRFVLIAALYASNRFSKSYIFGKIFLIVFIFPSVNRNVCRTNPAQVSHRWNVTYTSSISLAFAAVNSAVTNCFYGNLIFFLRLTPLERKITPLTHTHWTRPLVGVTSGCRGEAERNEMLLLLLVRVLFKLSAAAPPLLVLLKLEPRNGSEKQPSTFNMAISR